MKSGERPALRSVSRAWKVQHRCSKSAQSCPMLDCQEWVPSSCMLLSWAKVCPVARASMLQNNLLREPEELRWHGPACVQEAEGPAGPCRGRTHGELSCVQKGDGTGQEMQAHHASLPGRSTHPLSPVHVQRSDFISTEPNQQRNHMQLSTAVRTHCRGAGSCRVCRLSRFSCMLAGYLAGSRVLQAGMLCAVGGAKLATGLLNTWKVLPGSREEELPWMLGSMLGTWSCLCLRAGNSNRFFHAAWLVAQ